MTLGDPATWSTPTTRSVTDTPRYGRAEATGWDRMHPRLTRRGAWADHPGRLLIVEGTLIRLQRWSTCPASEAKPVWLWSSRTAADSDDDVDALAVEVICCWKAYLCRLNEEHTIRLFKQVLGWTAPKIRSPEAADRWTWLVLTAYTQLRLARPLAADLRRPWELPLDPERLTPARVRRGFRYLRAKTAQPASAPKPTTLDPDGHSESPTGTEPPATTSARPSNETRAPPRPTDQGVNDKLRAQSVDEFVEIAPHVIGCSRSQRVQGVADHQQQGRHPVRLFGIEVPGLSRHLNRPG
jgi:hypothetical protein